MIDNIKIEVEAYGDKYTFEFPNESFIEDVKTILKKILYCMGFHIDNIEELFYDAFEETGEETAKKTPSKLRKSAGKKSPQKRKA
jgi:hypothetical protein